MKNVYELTVHKWNGATSEVTNKMTFEGLQTVWDHLGFKLIRYRCGWGGFTGNTEYSLVRIK